MWLCTSTSSKGDEPICNRGPLFQLPLSNRAAQHFSHTMKLVSSRLLVLPECESSRLLVSPECFTGRMQPAGCMFITLDLFCNVLWLTIFCAPALFDCTYDVDHVSEIKILLFNLSVALMVRFTTNGMYLKNNTHIYMCKQAIIE